MYFMMELFDKNETLDYYIKKRKYENNPISEKEAIMILYSIIQGLSWLNKYGIMHRHIT